MRVDVRDGGYPRYVSATTEAIKPKVTVRAEKSGVVLTEGTNYRLSYRNNKARATATIAIEGVGEYQGTKEVTFQIV